MGTYYKVVNPKKWNMQFWIVGTHDLHRTVESWTGLYLGLYTNKPSPFGSRFSTVAPHRGLLTRVSFKAVCELKKQPGNLLYGWLLYHLFLIIHLATRTVFSVHPAFCPAFCSCFLWAKIRSACRKMSQDWGTRTANYIFPWWFLWHILMTQQGQLRTSFWRMIKTAKETLKEKKKDLMILSFHLISAACIGGINLSFLIEAIL